MAELTDLPTAWCRSLIADVANRHDLDPLLIEAMVLVESGGLASGYQFDPGYWQTYCVPTGKWAEGQPDRIAARYGLLQVMYPSAWALGHSGEPEELFIPAIGLEFGCRVLRDNLQWSNGNMPAALAAYNGIRTERRRKGPARNGAYLAKIDKALATVTAVHRP